MNIFVFGSNTQGRHGMGAALYARQHYGAIYGQAHGLQGQSYAIVTKELRLTQKPVYIGEIRKNCQKFIKFAESRPDLTFVLTPIGCGLGGFKPHEIAPLFQYAPPNVKKPKEFNLEVL